MEVKNNTINQRFELMVGDDLAELQYRMRDQTMYLMHTKVPDEMSGQGVASRLAKAALKHAKDNNNKIVVLCPFSVGYIKKHPEYLELIDLNYQQLDRFK